MERLGFWLPKTAQKVKFMFSNVAYRATVYKIVVVFSFKEGVHGVTPCNLSAQVFSKEKSEAEVCL